MDVIIAKNYEDMSRYTAKMIADFVRSKPNCVLGLATGSTPIGTYRELARMHREEGLDFSQVKTFNLDEYLGVGMERNKPYDLDQSYARFMYEELFRHINVQKRYTRVPNGLTTDPDHYCQWYEDEIKKAGGIDLQLLGIGGDGHWAFNEPGSSFSSRTRIEELTEQTLDDNYESFYKKAGISRKDMPHYAITMGIGTILEARNIIMMANGSKKANVIARSIEEPPTTQITASALQLHTGGVTIVLDEPAASLLKNTDRYQYLP
ncbi:MAG: glucosamine-6-phosphate deaminase [Eubacteriales bacterium]|jgi:glucosamine-6-phosphate deaminase